MSTPELSLITLRTPLDPREAPSTVGSGTADTRNLILVGPNPRSSTRIPPQPGTHQVSSNKTDRMLVYVSSDWMKFRYAFDGVGPRCP